jgi:hypothetical protein
MKNMYVMIVYGRVCNAEVSLQPCTGASILRQKLIEQLKVYTGSKFYGAWVGQYTTSCYFL